MSLNEKRITKPTEAGAMYQIETKTKRRDRLIKKIRKVINFITQLKHDDDNCDTVSDELFSISDILKDIMVVSNELRSYLTDDDSQQDEEMIDRFEEEVFDFKTQTHVWLAQARKNQEEKSTSSHGSRRSRRSRTSREEEKYAQTDQNRLQTEDDEIQLPTSPTSDAASLLIAKLLLQQSAPQVSIDTFKGDPLEFNYFIATFKEAIESKITDNRGRLTRLIKYVDGEPKELIKHCIHEPPSIGYHHAKELLQERYGDPYRIIACYRKELQLIDQLKPGDAAGFRHLYSQLLKYKSIVTPESYCNELNSPDLIRCLQSKLPMYLQDKWNRRAFDIRTKKSRPAIFEDFVDFVKDECALANDPMYSRQALNISKEGKPNRHNDSDRRRNGGLKVHIVKEVCLYCAESHHISNCKRFKDLTTDDRRKQLFRFRVCFYCYKGDHQARSCTSKKPCDICKGNHPTALHDNRFQVNDVRKKFDAEESTISSGCTNSSTQFSSLSIVPVKLFHVSNRSKVISTFALLDNCSQGSFIKESILDELSTSGEKTTITIKTMNGQETEESTVVTGIVASSYFNVNGSEVLLPRLYSRSSLPADRNDVPSKSALDKWNYLNDVKSFILSEGEKPDSIGLLIGTNCPKALEPKEVIPSQDGGPFAVLTNLGWSITGPLINQAIESNLWCNFVSVNNSTSKIIVPNKIDDTLIRRLICSVYESDFNEPQLFLQSTVTTSRDMTLSQEDRQFLDIMDRSVQIKDGHYVLPLPFRENDVTLPNNRSVATQRATYLKKRFFRDPAYFSDYKAFMNELIVKGYAKKSSTNVTDGKCWYIPHHGVYHPKKPTKIRVVFDCSSTYKGKSLNSSLLTGPDLTNLLVGVFTRFRKENVAVIADIEKMFYQVKVPEEQQNFLRFVWWPDGDVSQPLEDYQMCVHLFGGASSPACANYALKATATKNEKELGEEAAETLRRDFYVDDMLKSVINEEKALAIVKNVKAMCRMGGFNLTKFVSNSKRVLHSLETDTCKDDLKVEITKSNFQPERALGIHWCVQNDTLGFRIELKDKPLTRRGILSTVSSIYDPIGLAAPFLLSGKRLLQELCCDKKSWDDEISDEQRASWEKWRLHLPDLEKIEVKRCFKPEKFGKVIDASLHHFSDASTYGLGQASYIRLIDNNGMIHTTLIMGKSRVTPLRSLSIPRLELTAAVLSTKVSIMLRQELDTPDIKEYFWTDSEVVLAYLKNEKKRFHVFVANRIQLIRENTNLDEWFYVISAENPADDASRGLSTKQIEKNQRWFNGPSFLRQPLIEKRKVEYAIPDGDPETKKVLTVHTKVSCKNEILEDVEKHCSRWLKMKGVVFFILKWKYKWSDQTVENLQYVERVIIRLIQARAFKDDIKKLKNRQSQYSNEKLLLRSCKLHRLDPFIDENGVIRLGGRLKNSTDDFDVKHPIILPRRCATTNLIILHYHKVIEHQGRNSTLNEIRTAGFWVVNGNSIIRYLIDKCVRCRYLRGKIMFQKMADLPYDRVNQAPPFTYCAVDMFGPFSIKIGRKLHKRYGMLFTCLSSRAVHIEAVHSMDADSFILALRRLIARRGNIRLMRSDNGSNFIGADRELRDAIREMDDAKVKDFLLHKGCDFIFDWKRNPPTASSFGGVWERLIRSTRSILNNMLKSNGQLLDDESFVTFLTEAESIINSRPLSTETINDPDSPRPLTPNHFLTMKSQVIFPPPGNFSDNDMYCRKRWRRVQHLLNEFWNRWKKEYLSSLQRRSKWSKPRRNLNVGDIVLVNNYTQRNEWPIGLIVETLPGKDGYVRKAKVRFNNEIYERPIQKLILLLESA